MLIFARPSVKSRSDSMPEACAKNVYRVGMVSGKMRGLYTHLLHTLRNHVHKATGLHTDFPRVFPPSFHSQLCRFTSDKSHLYPLSTAPIISNHELEKKGILMNAPHAFPPASAYTNGILRLFGSSQYSSIPFLPQSATVHSFVKPSLNIGKA